MDLNKTHKEEIQFLVKNADVNLPEVLRMFAKEYHKKQLALYSVMHSFIIVGWEYNETWNLAELYFGEEDEILKTTDCFEKCIKFKTLEEAKEKLAYLKENFGDYGWYITII